MISQTYDLAPGFMLAIIEGSNNAPVMILVIDADLRKVVAELRMQNKDKTYRVYGYRAAGSPRLVGQVSYINAPAQLVAWLQDGTL